MDESSLQAKGLLLTKDSTLVDARNLLCPMPVIRVQEAVESLASGAVIKAICTDPGVLHDIPAWVRVHGHTLISAQEENDEYVVIVQVNKP